MSKGTQMVKLFRVKSPIGNQNVWMIQTTTGSEKCPPVGLHGFSMSLLDKYQSGWGNVRSVEDSECHFIISSRGEGFQ